MSGRSPDQSESSSKPRIFRLLASSRRRILLSCLQTADLPLHLSDLAREIAVREHDSPPTELPDEARKEIYLSLYHTHVPKLEEYGIVKFNQERKTLELTNKADHLTPYLERDEREQ